MMGNQSMGWQEAILAQLQAGAISLETAERLLLSDRQGQDSTTTSFLIPPEKTDIAIIGIACRFPGANDWRALWKNLQQGVDSIVDLPVGRWPGEDWYHPDPTHPDTAYIRCGGFLSQIDCFDGPFFQIAPTEAAVMDPQQRIFLEEAYHAIEDAGYAPEQLKGKPCGVFVGVGQSGYTQVLADGGMLTSRFAITGLDSSILAARIAYFLDLQGPALAIDTACSSSLTAIHKACESIRSGESELALAGGITLFLNPIGYIQTSQFQMLSPAGRCKTFDAAAAGFVPGEGCGVVLLKNAAQALADHDHIYAVIKGSAMNQDGSTNGITAPSMRSQTKLERGLYEQLTVNPATIGYIEAHGTGTALGDPIEVEALTAAFAPFTQQKQFCAIGSIKTNIGHTLMAAGVAGVIKAALSLKFGQLVPALHFSQPNPHINFPNTPFYVSTTHQPWPRPADHPRRAATSSFGMSGTNVHMVLEEAPVSPAMPNQVDQYFHLFTLSAKSAEALHSYVQGYQTFLATQPVLDLGDLCYTSHCGRSHFAYRLSIVASSLATLQTALIDLTAESTKAQWQPTTAAASVAFLFTGQGAQYLNMGRELYERVPLFRQTIDRCDELLRPHLGESLLPILYPPSGSTAVGLEGQGANLDHTTYTQPALFALEVALATLWRAWGIQPTCLLGHSIGELAAACVAGVFSLEDGLKLVAARARLMGALPQSGAMIALLTDEGRVRATLATNAAAAKGVTIAAVNGPAHVVISGQRELVAVVAAQLAAEGVKTRQLTVSHAFHSPLMAPMLKAFRQVAATITYHPPTVPLISNLTGKVAGAEIATPDYWVRHVAETVRFADGVATLKAQGVNCLLEIGPKPVLLGMAEAVLSRCSQNGEATAYLLPSLRTGRSDWQQILESLGMLYRYGAPIDWQSFHQAWPRRKLALPTYPFQRQRYWVEQAAQAASHPTSATATGSQHSSIMAHLQAGTLVQIQQQLEAAAQLSPAERASLPKLLALLQEQHEAEVSAHIVQDWLYHVMWQQENEEVAQRSTPSAESDAPCPHPWLIFADQQGLGEAVARALRQQGITAILVYAGTQFHQITADRFEIAAHVGDDYAKLLTQLQAHGPLATVLFLWGLDVPTPRQLADEEDTLRRLTQQLCGSTLYLVQALSQAQCELAGLWLVTCNAQAVQPTDTLTGVVQATLWGLGRVIGLEHPELGCMRLDLEDLTTAKLAEQAVQLLTEQRRHQHAARTLSPVAVKREDEVAWRGGKRYVARLARWAAPPAKPLAIGADATYLITGGLGGLGLLVARWLIEQGARHLLLLSRRTPPPTVQAQLDELQALGAQIITVQADVADRAQLAWALGAIEARYPLKGVIHAAGLLDDGALYQQTWSRFATVLAPKVDGAWHLHALTQSCDLDFFVLFSSLAGVLGNQGQANYAAGNAFLDALAHYRTAHQLPALSIDWGAWSTTGLAARRQRTAQAEHSHVIPEQISPRQGVAALARLLGQELAQVGVMPPVRPAFWQTAAAERPFFADLRLERSLPTESPDHPVQQPVPTIRQQLEDAPVAAHQGILLSYLSGLVAKVLGYPNTALIDPTQKVIALGMDSLMAVELRNQLRRECGYNLEFAQILEGISINEMVTAIATAYTSAHSIHQPQDRSNAQETARRDQQPLPPVSASTSREGEEEWVTIKI